MKRYELIVFDWDGTLVDSIGQIVDCIEYAIEQRGFPRRSPEQIREIIGLGMFEATVALFPDADQAEFPAFSAAYRERWMAAARNDLRLFDGAQALLRDLVDQNYRLAVATGKSRAGLDHAFEISGLKSLFETSRCADETASKPEPDMLLEILAELNISADKALMIGDSVHDLEMARRAGVDSVGVLSGVHDAVRMQSHDPVQVLDRSVDLPGWLAS